MSTRAILENLKFKFSTVKYRIALSLLIALMVLLLGMIPGAVFTVKAVSEEMLNNNINAARVLETYFDNLLDSVKKVAVEFFLTQNSFLEFKTANNSNFRTPRSLAFRQRLADSVSANAFISAIYIYYPKSDFVIGNLGVYPTGQYFFLQNNSDGLGLTDRGFSDWRRSVLEAPAGSGFLAAMIDDKYSVYYRLQFLGTEPTMDYPAVVIRISDAAVKGLLASAVNSGGPEGVAITDSKGDTIYSQGNSSLGKEIVRKKLGTGTGGGSDPISDRRGGKIFISLQSKKSAFRYSIVSNENRVLKKAYLVRNILLISLAICVITSVLITLLAATRLSRPIEGIVKMLDPSSPHKDEYEIIRHYLSGMQREKEGFLLALDNQQQLLNTTFAARVAVSEDLSSDLFFSMAGLYNIQFEHPTFRCGLCAEGPEDLPDLVRLYNQTARDLAVFQSETPGYHFFLFNCDESCDAKVFEAFFAFVTRGNHPAAVGPACSDAEDLPKSRKRAEELFRTRNESTVSVDSEDYLDHGGGNNPSIAKRARDLIDRDYADRNMGLYLVAEQLGVSQSYLSRIFKRTFQIGIVEYLNRLRIDRAKALLASGRTNVKHVSKLVGFSNDVHFIRVFKKYEQTTPGKYGGEST